MVDARVLVRLVVAIVLLAGVVVVLGPERMVSAFGAVKPLPYVFALLAEISALVFWGICLAILIDPIDDHPTGLAYVGAYCTGMVIRSLVPWGRSGGAVFTAVALSRGSSAGIERFLATALAADLLRFLVSIAFVGVGLVLLSGATVGAGTGPLMAVFAVAPTVIVVATLVITSPDRVTAAVVAIAGVVGTTLGRLSSTVAATLDRDRIRDRSHRFFETVDTLSHDRPSLVAATVFAALGWAAHLLPMYFSLHAAGTHAAFPVVMFIVPLAGFAGVAPLPGGTGGIEVALVGLLVVVAGIDITVAGVVTVLYRVATYWFSLGLSAIGAVLLTSAPLTDVQSPT